MTAPAETSRRHAASAGRIRRAGSPSAAGRRGRIRSSFWRRRRPGRSVLLIAPTGAGKTLAGFLPSLVDLAARRGERGEAGRAVLRAAHALRLAAEGARGRHPPQPRNAGRRDGPADPAGDAHRRHAGLQAAAPETRSARHPAHHAGAGGAAARLEGCAALLRAAEDGDLRRAAFAGRLEARRSSVARPRAAPKARARA